MTPQELKNSILQLAIQGKLVEQRAEEGTAEELYRQIQAEKQALIKAGKIKKEKPSPEITEDEQPFEIPESWIWVRLGDCTSYAYTKEKVTSNDINPDVWSLDLEDIEKDTGKIINYCKAKNRKITGDKVVFYQGQILYSKLRPYLKKTLVAPYDGICTPELVPFFSFGGINPYYLVAVLKTPYVDYVINSVTYGVKMPRVGTETMINLLIPLPPLTEQKRIVAKIEELLPLIDRYEAAWTRLEDFNKRFPGDMQKSILQMAIQGKLVPQNASEGTGEELYQQIQAEKQALIKAGKIKKEKTPQEITEDEIPFEIPGSWKWIRLGESCSVVTGRLDANAQDKKGKYAFFTCGVEVYKTLNYAFDCDAILLGGNNASGDYKMHRYCGKFNAYQRVYVISCQNINILDYLYYVIKSWLPSLKRNSQGTTTRFIKLGQVTDMLVPLPPLAEQKRIVARLEELLPLCERLKS